MEPSATLSGVLLAHAVGAPALMLAYMSTIVLLSRHALWGKRLQTLAPVEQMALSNYLTQSLVCTIIFYGYGLGLYAQVGTAFGMALAESSMRCKFPSVIGGWDVFSTDRWNGCGARSRICIHNLCAAPSPICRAERVKQNPHDANL